MRADDKHSSIGNQEEHPSRVNTVELITKEFVGVTVEEYTGPMFG